MAASHAYVVRVSVFFFIFLHFITVSSRFHHRFITVSSGLSNTKQIILDCVATCRIKIRRTSQQFGCRGSIGSAIGTDERQ
jgi:hypothetical protein